ncbi:MAG: ribonuclease T2 [Terracidiphilus sp.]
MKLRILAIALAFLLPIAGCKSRPQNASEAAPGGPADARSQASGQATASGSGFDFYLLNLSWSPEFCYSHPNASECAAHAAFVLHGLWPENNDGSYPEGCSNAPGPADAAQYRDIYPDPGLLEHEWQTHGTCSGLSPDAFFQTARSAFRAVAIPTTLSTLRSQTSLPPDQIIDLFTASNPAIPRSSFVVSCGHNYLTAVEVCVDKSLHPVPCTAIRSCRANTVRIPPP